MEDIAGYISTNTLLQKTTFTLTEAARYTGLSKSYLYKKTSARQIPFYKLEGKLIFFKREELDKFLLSTRIPSEEELIQDNMESITIKTKQHGKK
ncbi:MAG: helix-turn-helix domain-containing protein [Bacteroidetes bacterium]|nr:helix-turn-helix domain-containing protein [Bacteroidota bacterium]